MNVLVGTGRGSGGGCALNKNNAIRDFFFKNNIRGEKNAIFANLLKNWSASVFGRAHLWRKCLSERKLQGWILNK